MAIPPLTVCPALLTRPRLRLALCSAALLCLIWALPARAHNGAVAVAHPVTGIAVDGDLSDWPAGLPDYGISLPEYGDPPQRPEDLEAHFRVGYDLTEKALYVAIDVRDESIVLRPDADPSWDTQDGCEVYLDIGHGRRESPVVQHTLYGVAKGSSARAAQDQATISAFLRAPGRRSYEWRFDLRQAFSQQSEPWAIIGFDVVVLDRDTDGSFSWLAWGRGTVKTGSAAKRGDLIVLGATPSGELTGRVRQYGAEHGVTGGQVEIQSLADEDQWVRIQTDGTGAYHVRLPEGRFRVSLEVGAAEDDGVIVEIPAGGQHQVDLEVPAVQGRSVVAGPGHTVIATGGFAQGAWRKLGQVDGLATGDVTAILQGRSGVLWVATSNGLSRYDGYQFTSFDSDDGLAHDAVTALWQNEEGSLWIGTRGGLGRYDGHLFTNFTTADGLVADAITALTQDGAGNLWIGTEGGLSRYDGQAFTNFTSAGERIGSAVTSLARTPTGELWIGTSSGLYRYDGEAFVQYTTAEGLPDNSVTALAVDPAGSLWIGSSHGLGRYDGQHFTAFGADDGLTDEAVSKLLADESGDLWLGTGDGLQQWRGAGLACCDPTALVSLAGDGLGRRAVSALSGGHSGVIWIGSGDGLHRYDGKVFRHLKMPDDGSALTATCLTEGRAGEVWLGTAQGVVLFRDGVQPLPWPSADLNAKPVAASLRDGHGVIWFGTPNGLYRFDGRRLSRYSTADGLAHDDVRALLEDHRGDLWIGTALGGVSRYDG